jgi:Tol biopolymer transport system component
MRPAALLAAAFALLAGCSTSRVPDAMQVDTAEIIGFMEGYVPADDTLRFTGEVHLRNIRQLTFGGNNAEAYWSFDGTQLIFQSDWDAINTQGCDQQYVMNADGSPLPSGQQYDLVSTGAGRTTCGYFLADGRMIYSSTHVADRACPVTAAERTGAYVWDVFDTFDIYVTDGTTTELLIGGPGYDAEPTVSPDGRFVIFTSTRSGDLELYRYEVATGEILQLTDELGYDGGAFFSPDGSKILWRASRPTGAAADRYRELLTQNAVQPGAMNLYVANADGSDARQITDLPGANWAPFFHPSGEKILFSTNHHTMASGGREFDLFLVNLDGTGLQRVTHSGTFDAFPMFSPDGRRLVFASNRRADRADSRDTNIFVADWVEEPADLDTGFRTLPPR